MLKNSFIYVIGMVISKGIFYLLTPVYTTYLNPSEFGLITLVNTLVGLVSIFFVFGMNSSLTRYYVDRNTKSEKRVLVSTTLVFLLTLGIVITLLLYLLKPFLIDLFNLQMDSEMFWIILFLSLTTIFQVIPQTILRMEEKAVKFILFSIADSSLVFLFTYGFIIIYSESLEGALIALVIARLVIVLFYCFFIFRYLNYKIIDFNYKLLKEMLFYGIPLIPHSLAIWINNLSDRVLIERNLSLLEVGIYSLGAQFSSMLMLLVTSFSQAFTPSYFKRLKADSFDQSAFNKLIITSLGFLSVVSIIIYNIAPSIINLIADDSYSYNYNFIGILFISSVFQLFYIFGFAPLSYYRKNKDITKVTLIASILNLILNFILIPLMGIMGAAISSAVSYFMRFILVYSLSVKFTKRIYNWPKKSIIIITLLLFINLIGITGDLQLPISIVSIVLILYFIYNISLKSSKQHKKM